MDKPVLKDPDVFPDEKVLAEHLAEAYLPFEKFIAAITAPPLELSAEWKYYKDGNNWLCKISFKKKTIIWMSIWDGFFKTTLYFNAKTISGVYGLATRLPVEDFIDRKEGRKFIPVSFDVRDEGIIEDILKVAEYKKSLK
ncbi:MAG: DUF3788 family protein [bacterium]